MQPLHAVSVGSGGVVPQMMMSDYSAAGEEEHRQE